METFWLALDVFLSREAQPINTQQTSQDDRSATLAFTVVARRFLLFIFLLKVDAWISGEQRLNWMHEGHKNCLAIFWTPEEAFVGSSTSSTVETRNRPDNLQSILPLTLGTFLFCPVCSRHLPQHATVTNLFGTQRKCAVFLLIPLPQPVLSLSFPRVPEKHFQPIPENLALSNLIYTF